MSSISDVVCNVTRVLRVWPIFSWKFLRTILVRCPLHGELGDWYKWVKSSVSEKFPLKNTKGFLYWKVLLCYHAKAIQLVLVGTITNHGIALSSTSLPSTQLLLDERPKNTQTRWRNLPGNLPWVDFWGWRHTQKGNNDSLPRPQIWKLITVVTTGHNVITQSWGSITVQYPAAKCLENCPLISIPRHKKTKSIFDISPVLRQFQQCRLVISVESSLLPAAGEQYPSLPTWKPSWPQNTNVFTKRQQELWSICQRQYRTLFVAPNIGIQTPKRSIECESLGFLQMQKGRSSQYFFALIFVSHKFGSNQDIIKRSACLALPRLQSHLWWILENGCRPVHIHAKLAQCSQWVHIANQDWDPQSNEYNKYKSEPKSKYIYITYM